MKKAILLFCAAILISKFSPAQIKYGVAGGVNISTLKGDAVKTINNVFDLASGIVDQRSHTGISIRAFAEIPVSEKFSVEPGLSYNQKGYTLKGDFTSGFLKLLNANATLSGTGNYIGADALAKIMPAEGLHIKFGPQLNYLAASNLKVKTSVLGFNLLNESINITSGMKRIEAALTAGLGYEFGNGISLSGFYTHGLSPVDEKSNFKAYNRSAGLTLGYKL